ncbi:MAG: hypothetical protein H7061_13100 [Bdellovibrionaceae bacterium]|nr:hypothetical protein [Bdellovibrio sp.]
MSSITYRIAQLDDVEKVYQFEMEQKFQADADEYETQMLVWDSSFRKESLEHHFKLGWSFVAIDKDNQIAGFFLGQPLLFFDRQTQTLWVEYISSKSDEVNSELIDIAYRLSREKHFQRVLFSSDISVKHLTKPFSFQPWDRQTVFLKTTK